MKAYMMIKRCIWLVILLVVIPLSFIRPQEDEGDNDRAVSSNGVLLKCGVERWAVKTLIGADTSKIDFRNVVPSSIAYQRSLPAPSPLPTDNTTRLATEDTVYTIVCHLMKHKLESDEDIHLEICTIGNTSETMVAEIVNPECPSIIGTSRYASLKALRDWFVAKYNPTTSFTTVSDDITLTGVGFFDFLHGQTGIPPNGREIHPILSVQLGVTDVDAANAGITKYALEDNYPNPFNPSTLIKYAVPYESNIQLTVYNVVGKEVKQLRNEIQKSGNYELTFNSENLASGAYFLTMKAMSINGKHNYTNTKKLLILK